jgi:hypothetical protein
VSAVVVDRRRPLTLFRPRCCRCFGGIAGVAIVAVVLDIVGLFVV